MAVIFEKNSIDYIAQFPPVRCDTHFKHNIGLADKFFSNNKIIWVSLGSVLKKMQNGMNIPTEYYSMEKTCILYISVSQVKEYGLIKRNQNYLTEEIKDHKNFFKLNPNMVLITRSGTIGVALSTNHRTFDFKEFTYIPSGFVITAAIKKGFSADIIAGYINLSDVQNYLAAMASGACQKNLSQPVIKNLPVPEALLTGDTGVDEYFSEYGEESTKILGDMEKLEKKLSELKADISVSVRRKILEYYG